MADLRLNWWFKDSR